jgi:phage head maturation protease
MPAGPGRVAGSPAALGPAMAPQPPLCAAAPSHRVGLSGEPSGHLAIGVARSWAVIPGKGLGVEAELVVRDAELDSWRRRFQHGLSCGLSIGFRQDKRRTRWERPARSGSPPRKRPRGVEIEELSLVQWPAYLLAGVTAMAQRSADDQRRHEESQQIIREWETHQLLAAHEARMRAKKTA